MNNYFLSSFYNSFGIKVQFDIPCAPVPKARPRTVSGSGGFVRTYTPAKTVNYEMVVKKYAKIAMNGRPPLTGPVQLKCSFDLPIPKSWPKKKKADALAGKLLPISRPDIDNYIKAVLDAANEIVVRDDSQVVALVSIKQYSETPKATLVFEEIKYA